MKTKDQFCICDDLPELFREAAKDFACRAERTIWEKGFFSVALSGGNTPQGVFRELAQNYRTLIKWDKVHFFWGDERYVAPSHQESNFGMANRILLSQVDVPKENIHAIPTDFQDAHQAAVIYQQKIRGFFQEKQVAPSFDLIYLGMGEDGHTASLFPGADLVNQYADGKLNLADLVGALWVEKHQQWRISFTPNLINQAHHIVFLIAGSDKAKTLAYAVEGGYQPKLLPIQLIIQGHDNYSFFLDAESATQVCRSPQSK